MGDLPLHPDAGEVARMRRVVVAGHTGQVEVLTAHIDDRSATVRAATLSALERCGALSTDLVRRAFGDPAPSVRSRAAELAVSIEGVDPAQLLDDGDASVVEVACFSCGEHGWTSHSAPIDKLARIATSHEDPLCRESAAAALGAIGDARGLDAVLTACQDRVTVRRRATLALAAFVDPRAEAMLKRALDDKDWQVRQAAEDLLEVGRRLDGPPDPDAYAD